MVLDRAPIYYEQKAIVTRVTQYFAYVQLQEGPAAAATGPDQETPATYSIMVNKVRISGHGFPLTSFEDGEKRLLQAGDEVRVSYTTLPQNRQPLMLLLTAGADPEIRASMVQVQQMADEVLNEGGGIQKRIGKTIDAPTTLTPDALKSAVHIKSPIDMRDVLVQPDTAGNQAHESDAASRADLDSVCSGDSEASR